MPYDIKQLEEMERAAVESLDPDSDDYDSMVSLIDRNSAVIDNHYKRQVDDQGKLTAAPQTRQPAMVGTDHAQSHYFFEPNVKEVQEYLRRNPEALDRLTTRDPLDPVSLRTWGEGEKIPASREPVADSMTGMVQGYNTQPAVTYLDALTEDDEPYGVVADDMWSKAAEAAKQNGDTVKRYKDIKLDKKEWKDYIGGGIRRGVDRIITPAALGAADSLSASQASPMLDAMGDLAKYRQGVMTPEEKTTARAMGYDPDDSDYIPTSSDVKNRSMPAYIAGNIGGYALGSNPSNMIQGAASKALGYEGAGVLGRVGAAALAGGAANAEESVLGDLARYANEGQSIPVGNIALNAAVAGGFGVVGGGAFDAVGQALGKGRDTFREYARNAPLRTLEEGGGSADVAWGAVPPEEVRKANVQVRRDRSDPRKAPTTAAGKMSAELAPQLEQSVRARQVAEQKDIGDQMSKYYAHPDYRDVHHTAAPAVQALVDLSQGGFGRSPADGSSVPMDPPTLKKIGNILYSYAKPIPVLDADAGALAHTTGGILIDAEHANHLFADVMEPINPGQKMLLSPVEMNAKALTTLEGRIYRELNFSSTRGDNDDPVWKAVDRGIKDTRDQFRLFRDEDGNLVAPPPDSVHNEPFGEDPQAAPPRNEERMTTLPRPIPIEGGGAAPEAIPGAGPGQPDLPSSPFDALARIQQPQGGVDALPRPIGVGGEGMVARPEGLYGVGPGGPPIPENPFDQRLPVARERVAPLLGVDVQGGEYGPPQQLDPNARMGIGPHRKFETYEPAERQQTVDVQGTYNKPPAVEHEPAPATNRNPYGFADRGQPPHETPLPPSERAQVAPEDATPLSMLAGNELAMPIEEPPASGARGPDSDVRIGEAATMKVAKKLKEVAGQSPQAIANKPDIVALLKERDALPMVYDDAKETEAMMSGLKKRGASQLEIETAMLQYQIERGKAAAARGEPPRPNHQRTFQESPPEADAPRERTERAGPPPKVSGLSPEETIRLINGRYDAKELATRAKDLQDHGFRVTPNNLHARDQLGGADRMGSPDANGNAGNKALSRIADDSNKPFLDKEVSGYEGSGSEKRGGLEMMLDEQLDRPDAPRVPNTEIEEIGALQTADREQVAADQKTYVDDIFSPGAEARANEVEKVKHLLEHQEVIDEAMRIVNDVDRRLGGPEGIPQEQKRAMLVGLIENKLGRKIDVEDLIRAGLISAGLVEMATSDDDESGAAVASIGMLGFGRGKKGKGTEPAEVPKAPKKPTEPTAILDDGTVVKGFSAMRSQQHDVQTATEKAMKRLGVEGDNTLEGRIRTYGQLDDRAKIDQALLDEASGIGKAKDLRKAAAANAYGELRDRSSPFGSMKGMGNALIDFFGFRAYKAAEYPAGRFSRDQPRNPFADDPDTTLGKIKKTVLEDPARRLTDLTQGGPYSRLAAKKALEMLKEHKSTYLSVEDEEKEKKRKEKKQSASP